MLISQKMFKLAKKDIPKILLVAVLQFAINLIIIAISKNLASGIVENNKLIYYTLSILVLVLFYIIVTRLKIITESKVDYMIKSRLRKEALSKLFDVGLENINIERTGGMTTTLVLRIDSIARYCSLYIPIILATIATNLVVALLLLSYNKGIALVFTVGFIGILLVPQFWYLKIWSKNSAIYEEMANYKSEFLDNIQGMATLKSLEARKTARENMKFHSKEIRRVNMDSLTITGMETLFIYLFLGLMIGISIAYGGLLLSKNLLSHKDFILLLFIISSCSRPVLQLVNAWHIGNSGLACFEKYEELMGLEKRRYIENSNETLSDGLLVENLSYSYDKTGHPLVLKKINFNIDKGKKIAIVGKSGSGKSTLVSIIAGLYPYCEGKISFDGLVLNNDNLNEWKSMLGAVWQEQFIFNGSIRENMLLAKKDASDSEIYAVFEELGLKDFIDSLQLGLDTHIGESGVGLSGGERQRLAIARIILRNPKLMILDESSSNLDEKNQNYIKDVIKRLPHDKTCIIVAHRLSTIEDLDEIFVLENGEIVDSGIYEELLNSSPAFNRIHQYQLKGDL